MFSPKLKIPVELWEKMREAAEVAMAQSVDEWAMKVLKDAAEKTLKDAGKDELSEADVDDITKKLQGLGYLD